MHSIRIRVTAKSAKILRNEGKPFSQTFRKKYDKRATNYEKTSTRERGHRDRRPPSIFQIMLNVECWQNDGIELANTVTLIGQVDVQANVMIRPTQVYIRLSLKQL